MIVMMGPSLASPGGMAAVACTLRDAGLFDRLKIDYIASYDTPEVMKRFSLYISAIARLFYRLITQPVSLLYLHSASRGSFWRKSIVALIARLLKVPYILHIHSGEFTMFYDREAGPLMRWWIRHTLRRAKCVICLTPTWRERLMEISSELNVVVIGNGVAVPETYRPPRPVAREVLFLGRLRQKKGIFDLVASMPTVLKQCPDIRFVLAGDGPRADIEALAEQLGVRHAIELPGWVDGPRKEQYLDRADLFVLPSYYEGLPMCLLEAMARGIPIVSTTVGGIPDLLEHDVHALLVEPGDVAQLGSALAALTASPDLRNRLSVAAFERVRNCYSLQHVCDVLSNVLVNVSSEGMGEQASA